MLQPNRESLEVTINKIKKNEILLPDFQRQFVWKEEEMQHKLVASVLTKMPIGSILLLKSKDAHDYSCKPLGAKDPIPSEQLPSGAVEFLLDGQQRMTVLANVFSDAIFQLTPQSNNLIAPSALKRRFYLAVPKYGNDAFPDLFGLHSLSFPMRTPDSDEPEFLTQDILPFIRVVPFNVKRDNGKCYNQYSRPIPRMLSELETYCPSVEDGHFLAVGRVAADGRVDRARVIPDPAADEADIGPCQRMVLELRGERGVGGVVFRRDDEAGGILVDPVDDAGALFPADAGERVAAVREQRVDQRSVRVPRRGMDDESLGLVDDDDIRVLVADLQRDRLRLDRDLADLRERQLQRISG